MHYRQTLDHAFGDSGSEEKFSALHGKTDAAVNWLKAVKDSGEFPPLALPSRTDDLEHIKTVAAELARFAHLVVLGTGGASLGGQALCALKRTPAAVPKVLFLDNIDPETTDGLLGDLALQDTAFLVISKSGATAETLAQALALFDAARAALGDTAAKHFTAITAPGNTPLRTLAVRHGWRCLDHDPKLGGRFSALSPVGLIPAAVAGLDVRALRNGAATVLEMTLAGGKASDVAKGAAFNVALSECGRDVNVWMPYADRFGTLGLWYLQIWSESVGKDGKGATPVRAIGATDQHSQLQLYLDGPRNKYFTLLLPETQGAGRRLPDDAAAGELGYLAGHTLGDVMAAEQRSTAATLINHRHPVRLFELPPINEEVTGALMMHFMLETILVTRLTGVNAFDQPAVEEGKRLVREYLGDETVKEASHG